MKRIIICADGTWNIRDQVDKVTGKRRPTNVTKVARAILPRAHDGIDQIVYYHDGIGTGSLIEKDGEVLHQSVIDRSNLATCTTR